MVQREDTKASSYVCEGISRVLVIDGLHKLERVSVVFSRSALIGFYASEGLQQFYRVF